ncbi:MAG: hypothetical protein AAGI38_11850 [Bacteroidota bacterium]
MIETEKTYSIKLVNISTKEITEHKLLVIEGLHPENGNILWKVEFDFFGDKIEVGKEYFLSNAIDGVRRIIEPLYYRMLIRWCEIDAVQSGMIADMTAGRKFYKYEIVKKVNLGSIKQRRSRYKKAIFSVLAEALPENVVSLIEQETYRNEKYFSR